MVYRLISSHAHGGGLVWRVWRSIIDVPANISHPQHFPPTYTADEQTHIILRLSVTLEWNRVQKQMNSSVRLTDELL
jgi:hypothetical protein